MKPLNGYKDAKAYSETEKLPVGGYVLKVLEVKEINYSWGDVLQISFDIIEGEHKDFFKNDYKSQTQEDKKWRGNHRLNIPKDDGSEKDNWTMRTFKTAMTAFEESNKGYHWNWDEQTLKGKIVGAVFNNQEWEFDGRTGWRTACAGFRAADVIRSGKYKLPADKPLKAKAQSGGQIPEGFDQLEDLDDTPF